MLILAADLGGTHSRFALFKKTEGRLEDVTSLDLPSDERDYAALLRRTAELLPGGSETRREIAVVSIAAAGAVHGGRVRMTNAPYVVDAEETAAFFPNARVLLMNDFEAQAWSCVADAGQDLEPLQGDAGSVLEAVRRGEEKRPVAVLGAGTGLGAAWLARSPGGSLFTLPSEAGHASFPMHGSDELAFASFLAERSRCTFITAEQVLSGRGLALLYEHCEGSAGLPEDFTCAAAFEASACCGFFARFYGRFCRMAALFLLPSAIVLAGGVAGKTPCLVHHPEFLREFLRPGSAAPALLESIPLALNRNSRSGLYGAAYAAWHLLERAAGRTA